MPGPILPPSDRPDEVSLAFAAARPHMPSRPAGLGSGPPGAPRPEATGEGSGGRSSALRTDLALEAYAALAQTEGAARLPGVTVDEEPAGPAWLRRVRIGDPATAARLGKAPGVYSTIECPSLWERSREGQEATTKLMSRELARLLSEQGIAREAPVLVAGLGNWNATPDSLGPRVVGQLLVTRHLQDLLPPEKRGTLRPVAAISPGVLGLTGVETTELVAAVVQRIRPACVVCVDALAAAGVERLCTTVQLSDAGIQPGAGVGNRRMGLTRQTVGVPVVAVGVPTVIHATQLLSSPVSLRPPGVGPQMAGGLPGSGSDPRLGRLERLVVTPKEIDILIEDASKMLAGGINAALHEGVDVEEVLQFLQ